MRRWRPFHKPYGGAESVGFGDLAARQFWSIGFPLNSGDPAFVRDAVFQFTSLDGLGLSGGTVVPPGELAPATILFIPEPSSAALWQLAAVGILAWRARHTWGAALLA